MRQPSEIWVGLILNLLRRTRGLSHQFPLIPLELAHGHRVRAQKTRSRAQELAR